MSKTLRALVNEGYHAALLKINPALCGDLDSLIRKGEPVETILEKVKSGLRMRQVEPNQHQLVIDSIRAYVVVEQGLRRREA